MIPRSAVSRTKLKALSESPDFRQQLELLTRRRREHAQASVWYQENHADQPLSSVAYFSMEFMLSEALPIYSGGLGNVAGDQLKAASDLGVPVVGVGLLYQQGYFRQVLTVDGSQRALYPYNDPMQLPITPVRDGNGEWVRLEIVLPGSRIWLRAWQVQVGRVKVYLLDSNDPANMPDALDSTARSQFVSTTHQRNDSRTIEDPTRARRAARSRRCHGEENSAPSRS
jgi:glycogen phosphorylase